MCEEKTKVASRSEGYSSGGSPFCASLFRAPVWPLSQKKGLFFDNGGLDRDLLLDTIVFGCDREAGKEWRGSIEAMPLKRPKMRWGWEWLGVAGR